MCLQVPTLVGSLGHRTNRLRGRHPRHKPSSGSASHCQPFLSRNTKIENTNRSIVTEMMVKTHTCRFHLCRLRIIVSGGFVNNVLRSHLQLQRHHFCNTTSCDHELSFFHRYPQMRNGTSTVWLLVMEAQSHITVMLAPISSLSVIVSATLPCLCNLFLLSLSSECEMKTQTSGSWHIWLLAHLAHLSR